MAAEDEGHTASDELARLGAEFARLRRRADRLRQRVQRVQAASEQQGAKATWQAWSDSVDSALALVDRIGRLRAASLEDLAIKYDALAWRLCYDDALLDRSACGRIDAFGRELAMFARRDSDT